MAWTIFSINLVTCYLMVDHHHLVQKIEQAHLAFPFYLSPSEYLLFKMLFFDPPPGCSIAFFFIYRISQAKYTSLIEWLFDWLTDTMMIESTYIAGFLYELLPKFLKKLGQALIFLGANRLEECSILLSECVCVFDLHLFLAAVFYVHKVGFISNKRHHAHCWRIVT